MAITLKNVRLSYVNLFQPKAPFNNPAGEPKYGVTILIPKSNVETKADADQEVARTIEVGMASKWNGVRPPQPAICIHDGDGPRPSDGSAYGEECRGCWVLTASCKERPFVVDGQLNPIIDPTQVYSGMWGNVSVTFFPYNNAGKKGIGCGLNGVQKIKDDDPLNGRVTAQEAFTVVTPAPAYQQPAPAYQQPAPSYQQPAYQQPVAYGTAASPAYGGYGQAAIDPITGQPLPF